MEVLDLFIQSPNTKDERGQTRDRFVPNPEYTSPKSIQMYEFVGVWMGISFRTKSTLPFQLSSMVWKTLVGERLTLEDVEEIDDETVSMIHSMRATQEKVEDGGGEGGGGGGGEGGEAVSETTGESSSSGTVEIGGETKSSSTRADSSSSSSASSAFENNFGKDEFTSRWSTQPFQTRKSDMISVVDLIPGGADIFVTYNRRHEYADLVEAYHIHEFDQQLAAMKRGFGTIVRL